MKKKYISLMICLVLSSLLFGCGKNSNTDKKISATSTEEDNDIDKGTTTDVPLDFSETDIILIRDYINYAEGYERYGYFIDGAGNIYNYNFADGYYPDNSMNREPVYSMTEELQLIRQYAFPTGSCDISTVQNIYKEGMLIDPDAKMNTGMTACDAGESSLYFHNPETDELILVSGDGDTELIPTDKHAETIAKLEEMTGASKNSNDPIMLFTTDYYNFASSNCGYMDNLEDNYVLLNQREVSAFKELTGIDINSFFPDIPTDSDESTSYGRYIYFVSIENVSSTGHNIVYDAMLKQGDNYVFLPGKDYKAPASDEMVGEAMDGFINVAAVYFTGNDPEYYNFLNWGGSPLKRVATNNISIGTDNASDYEDIFEDISGDYYFASGAGAWSTDLTLYEDGTFDAQYHDSNMGESGDGYDGTTYFGICSGKFTITGKVDDNIYEMEMEITDHSPMDEEYIETYEDSNYKNRMVSTDVYGIDGGTTFWLILEGVPTDMLPEEYISSVSSSHGWGMDTPASLPFNGIYNVDEAYGFGQ